MQRLHFCNPRGVGELQFCTRMRQAVSRGASLPVVVNSEHHDSGYPVAGTTL
jgi:hypothetical protein